MTSEKPLTELSDDQLLACVKRLAAAERHATAALIAALMEFDGRRLYLAAGCSSMFTYCTQVLHMAEGAAYNRIEAARAARRFSVMLDLLHDGSVTLTTVRLLAPHLTTENHHDVLGSARHKSKREVEILVASLNPKPATPPVIRKLRAPREAAGVAPPAMVATTALAAEPKTPVDAPPLGARPASLADSPTIVTPLAPERYKLQLTISRETHDKLRHVQDLLRHTLPSGDPAEILDRAITLLLEDLERRRFAQTASPRESGTPPSGSRHIPAAVRREVWRRDEGQCAFVGTKGRCTERGFLEFHHVEPYAAGGAATAENIQLRCRAHNAYEALLFFGVEWPGLVRESQPEWPASEGRCSVRRE